ncbi:MAG: hypothetical protein J6O71_00030 [Lachnospiraceae bacterium]|nr:hypothetical protein [Lachnospiraceae bacterium]
MNYKTKRAIKTISLIAAILLTLFFLQEFVVKPWQPMDVQISGFYKEDKDSLDVVFIGASDMYNAFAPALAYKEFGFTSYPFAPPRNSVGAWQLQVDEIMRTQNPKLIVIEVNGALYTEEDALVTEENLRLFTDHMPPSRNKDEFIKKLVQKKDRVNYYIPYLKYHGNITSLKEAARIMYERLCFEARGGLYMKGERTHFEIDYFEHEMWDTKNDDEELAVEPMHEAALRSMLEYSLENVDCPILFIRAPHYITQEEEISTQFFHRTNRVGNIVQDYGYDFINFDKLHDELGLDHKRDFHNAEHLNINGQIKFTEYLGRLLVENYGLGDTEHSDVVRQKWERAVSYFDALLKHGYELMEREAEPEEYELYEVESQELLNIIKPSDM